MAVSTARRTLRVARDLDPLMAATRLAESDIFDTYLVYERRGTWTFFGGAESLLTLRPGSLSAAWHGGRPRRYPATTAPLRALASLLQTAPYRMWRAYGWASFELSYALYGSPERLTATVGDEPLLQLAFPLVEVSLTTEGALLSATSDELLTRCAAVIHDTAAERDWWTKSPSVDELDADYHRMVVDAITELCGRRLNKVILSRSVPVDFDIDLAATYCYGRRQNTPARSFLLKLGGHEAAGFSPETVVEVDRSGRVSTQPLAGTRGLLDANREENLRLRTALLRDPKEIFEHAISVKVAYDELTALCGPGSVRVDDFMAVRERGTVQHLASRVTGQLPTGGHAWDALAALFPAVTASGSPKPEALDAIRRYESHPRGLYGGAVFTVDSDGAMDAALALRAVYRRDGRTWLRAGAGIVEHSTPEREHEETCEKLRSVARCLVPANTALAGDRP